MRAIVVQRLGPPEVLGVEEIPVPEPAPGQVLVRIEAIGVNFAETERRRGLYPKFDLPWVPGTEGAGQVAAVGAGVDSSLINRRVAFWAMPPAVSGTYAEYAVAPATSLFLLGSGTPYDVGAAFPQQGLTAYGLAFFSTAVRSGARVLVHAAAGGVGQLLIQILRSQGAHVFGTVSTPEKAAAVAALGAEPLLYGEDLPERIADATDGHGLDRVFDSVGKATQAQSLAMLAPYGELIFFGDASGPPAPIDPDHLYGRSLKIGAFGLNVDRSPQAWIQPRRLLQEWIEAGHLKVAISRRFPLTDAAEAHRLLESRGTMGKVVLLPCA